jgi:membrane associated rhomboid family serine protease
MDATMQRGHKDTTNARSDLAGDRDSRRATSRRTALVLTSIAVAFFAGIILAQHSGSPSVGFTVLGFAILGFLIVAIGRNIRK